MAQKQTQADRNKPIDMASWKPGSEPEKARDVASAGDFGVPVGIGPSLERDYVTENTRRAEPGAAPARSGEDPDGARTTGAGGNASGTGSSSGGDIDTDIVGIGGSGLSAAGPDDPPRPGDPHADDTDFDDSHSPAAEGRNQTNVHKVGGSKRVRGGSVVQQGDGNGPNNQGADSATNPDSGGSDAFVGEISSGEARGEDGG